MLSEVDSPITPSEFLKKYNPYGNIEIQPNDKNISNLFQKFTENKGKIVENNKIWKENENKLSKDPITTSHNTKDIYIQEEEDENNPNFDFIKNPDMMKSLKMRSKTMHYSRKLSIDMKKKEKFKYIKNTRNSRIDGKNFNKFKSKFKRFALLIYCFIDLLGIFRIYIL